MRDVLDDRHSGRPEGYEEIPRVLDGLAELRDDRDSSLNDRPDVRDRVGRPGPFHSGRGGIPHRASDVGKICLQSGDDRVREFGELSDDRLKRGFLNRVSDFAPRSFERGHLDDRGRGGRAQFFESFGVLRGILAAGGERVAHPGEREFRGYADRRQRTESARARKDKTGSARESGHSGREDAALQPVELL